MIYTREMYMNKMRNSGAFMMNGIWHMPDGSKQNDRTHFYR